MYMFASRSELGYDPKYTYEFNPKKAGQLMKEFRYEPSTPVILTYTTLVPNADMVAAVIQKYMKDIGITVRLEQLEAGVQATYARNKDKWEGHWTIYSWAGGRDPST